MAVKLTEEVLSLLNDPATIKVLATTDPHGEPHAVLKGSLHADSEGNIVNLELLESSKSNSNLVHSLWFNRKVAVTLFASDGTSFEITGTPKRCVISGPLFEKYYRQAQERNKNNDLGAVWLIEPTGIRNETYKVRLAEETVAHPLFLHLDRIAK